MSSALGVSPENIVITDIRAGAIHSMCCRPDGTQSLTLPGSILVDFEVVYPEEDIKSMDGASNQNSTNTKSQGNETEPIEFSALQDMLVMRFVSQVRVFVVAVHLCDSHAFMHILQSACLPAGLKLEVGDAEIIIHIALPFPAHFQVENKSSILHRGAVTKNALSADIVTTTASTSTTISATSASTTVAPASTPATSATSTGTPTTPSKPSRASSSAAESREVTNDRTSTQGTTSIASHKSLKKQSQQDGMVSICMPNVPHRPMQNLMLPYI